MNLRAETWVPVRVEEVFPFFADARNLQTLTPPWLRFSIHTPDPIGMRAGTRIAYRITVHGIPLCWESVISAWEPPRRFVDEQRKGPYRRWVHTHRFFDERGGTRLVDEVSFELYVRWLAAPLVRRDLRRIFAYRHHVLHQLFSKAAPPGEPRIEISA